MPRIDVEAIEAEFDDEVRTPRRRTSRTAREKLERYDVGRVLGVDRGRVTVLLDGVELEAGYGGQMRGRKVVVGDDVRVKPARHRSDRPRVVDRLARRTALVRTGDDTDDDERVVVANADQVAVVIAADYLDGGVRFLDRVLVAAEVGGLAGLVVVNKVDLVASEPSEVDEVAERYARIGYEVVRTAAEDGTGLAALRAQLAGRWTAFTGHSGVGKSSLFNRLLPEADHQVRAVGRYGGRHTTVAARARRVPDGGDTWLVDTPGVRSFGLGPVRPWELPRAFPELRGLPCTLEDCLHDGEPGCAVDGADVHPHRLASYRRLLGNLRGEVDASSGDDG